MPKIAAPVMNGAGRTLEAAVVKTGECMFRSGGELRGFETTFYAREALPLDTPIDGPAIVLQSDTTTVVPPGATCTADASGNLLIRVGVPT